jgi:mono/diheme cytochrome c family protein
VNGVGQDNLIPPLKSSDYLLNNINLSIAGLKYGLKGEIIVNGKVYDGYMAYQGLDNDEIADVMNYILNQWGNNYEGFIDAPQVEKIPKSIFEK